jgi:hypothetical protein
LGSLVESVVAPSFVVAFLDRQIVERNDVFDLDPSGLSLDELIAADSNAFTADGDGVDELLQIAEELGIGEEIPLPD